MIDIEKLTRSNRSAVVVQCQIEEIVLKSDNPPFTPQGFLAHRGAAFEGMQDGDIVYFAYVLYRIGLDEPESFGEYFRERDEAELFAQSYPVGMTFGGRAQNPIRIRNWIDVPGSWKALCFHFSKQKWPHLALPDQFLRSAALVDDAGEPSEAVLNWAGGENIAWMKEEFGQLWGHVVLMEYCANIFPETSLVYMAAQIQFASHVSADDFTVGYLLKELQVSLAGIEETAMREVARQSLAGQKSGDVSSAKRNERLEALMLEIEKLQNLVPHISEKRILAQAWDNLASQRSDTPKTPKIRFEYEVALRSLGGFRPRYRAVFGESA